MNRAAARLVVAACIVLALLHTGCVSKSKARAEAKAAFKAGRDQATLQAETQRNNITFIGPVLNPVVPWTEGLTLAQAIVAARWSGMGDPRIVILTRADERVELTPNESIAAAELPLEPGDKIELLP